MGDLTRIASTYGEEVRSLDELWKRESDNLNRFRGVANELSPEVSELANNIADLYESGDIDYGQALRFFRALDELAQGSAESIAAA